MKQIAVLLAFSAILGAVPAADAQRQWGNSFSADEARSERDRGNVPLRTIFSNLKRQYGGYQIDANLYNRGGQQVYVIDWMTKDGERKRFTVDAKSGRVLSSN